MKFTHYHFSRKDIDQGFTLIEISIVLVIIGLLAGGILVGQTLIRAAEIRSQISQLDQYKLAVNTFELKYDDLPGDIPPQKAGQFGLFEVTGVGVGGNGDGRLGGVCSTESLLFWRHLTDAKLIAGQYGVNNESAIDPVTGYVSADVTNFSESFPPTKLPGGYVQVDTNLNNSFFLGEMIETGIGWCTTGNAVYSPNQFYAIDSKLDDGLPYKGRIQAYSPIWAPTSTPTNCIIGTVLDDPASTYNISGSNGDARICNYLYVGF